jgi:hypothetical protein
LRKKEIFAMAPWAWEGASLYDVNIRELREHYADKLKEKKA